MDDAHRRDLFPKNRRMFSGGPQVLSYDTSRCVSPIRVKEGGIPMGECGGGRWPCSAFRKMSASPMENECRGGRVGKSDTEKPPSSSFSVGANVLFNSERQAIANVVLSRFIHGSPSAN